MFNLSGRVALVTGGNGGIGLGLAQGLAASGARVAVVGRNAAKNDAAVAALGGGAFAVAADLSRPEAAADAVAQVLTKAGRLDILVNNAGINRRMRADVVTDEAWHAVIDTNLNAVMRTSRAAYPALKASGHGRVINIGSMMSIFATAYAPAYAASKGAVVQLTKSCAVAWAKDGITVNAILPGWIDTDMTRAARREVAPLHEAVLARTPAGRWGAAEDLSGLAAFLASDGAAFITGTAIPVDGGYAAQG
jgi:2-deoxy-D-gluconate 3-dehydrogenase